MADFYFARWRQERKLCCWMKIKNRDNLKSKMLKFEITSRDQQTRARTGILSTPHGDILTPSYVIVATHAKIKCLKPSDIKKTKTQVVIANTYHLMKQSKNVSKLLGKKLPTMTDSGGFQVFSLGFGEKNRVGKILTTLKVVSQQVIHKRQNIKIVDKGVYFYDVGNYPSLKFRKTRRQFLDPKTSIKIQEKLGADIIFAFDECTSPLDNLKYNQEALERTHRWAKESLAAKTRKDQMLFGIVQGGRFKNLRMKSAKFIGSLSFDGFGIGGSFGKKEMVKTLKWVVPHLPEEKPRHLLGIGRVEDVFSAVENGIDLFDCVIPTREARHGRIYTKHGHYDISKNHNKDILVDDGCECTLCKQKLTRAKLHELFKKDLPKAQRWVTIHNVWFFNNLLEQIRNSIAKGKFKEFKNQFLRYFEKM